MRLEKYSKHNDKEGTVLRFDVERNRYAVELDCDGSVRYIKAQNLSGDVELRGVAEEAQTQQVKAKFGMRLAVVHLEKHCEYNDKDGTVIGFDEEKGNVQFNLIVTAVFFI